MSCCNCSMILNLCKISACLGKLSLGVAAPVTGDYILEAPFLNSIFRVKKTFISGANIEFSLSEMNENYTYTAKVYKPDGTAILKRIGETDYDCFSFQTVAIYGETVEQNPIEDNFILSVSGADFVDGVYTGDVSEVGAVYDTGIPNFLTKGPQWDFVYSGEDITGIQIFVGIDAADFFYFFKTAITL